MWQLRYETMGGVNPVRRVRLQGDERRSQIVAAARKLFSQRAYSDVSTSEIASAAGVTRTNLHYHFGTKRDLFLEVVRAFTQQPPSLDDIGELGLHDAINEIVTRWLDTMAHTRDTYLSIFRAGTVSEDPELEEILNSGREAWAVRLVEALGIPGGTSPRTLALVLAYQAMAESAVVEWLRYGRLVRADVELLLVEMLASLIERIAPLR